MLIVLAANQLAGAKALEAAGAAISVGSPEEIKAVLPALLDKVKKKELLQRMVHSAANVTSGSGVAGVVEIMVKIAGESK
jgi:UDP-N-acetylglucosamine:LPS N-acetylglucosamine transferase